MYVIKIIVASLLAGAGLTALSRLTPRLLRPAAVALVTVLLGAGTARAADAADVVYRNARFYTVNERQPWAEAVAVRDGRFLRVGTTAEVAPLIAPATRIIDLGGRFVLPGLIDSHTHPSFEAEHPWSFESGFPWTFLNKHPRVTQLLSAWASQREAAVADSLRIMSSYGFTAFGEGKTTEEVLPVWESVIREKGLRQHVVMFMHALDGTGVKGIRRATEITAAFRRHDLPGVRLGAKIFVDGYLEPRTAALVEPYRTAAGSGRLNAPLEVIRDLVADLDRAGLPIQLHAIGDAGVRASLDALEPVLLKRGGAAGPTHTILHLKLVHDEDLRRFARLGVVASTYPFLAQPHPVNEFLAGALGAERVERSYLPLGKLWCAGATVAANSDWASSSMNPFYGMYVGVTRQSPGHPERGRLGAENALTLEQMIRAYTINSAVALGMERDAGSIEPGKWADMAVLDRDIVERPVEELLSTTVSKTIFKGEVVYDAAQPLRAALLESERALLEMGHWH
jgi:predicted amidohydrolase YtcJ